MIKPDLLVVLPKDTDFPIFRYNLTRFRDYFSKILVGINNNGGTEDFTEFFRNNIPGTIYRIDDTPAGMDWRDFAVKILLKHSDASHVFFTEPDFLIRDERFFEVLGNVTEYDFLYYDEGGRMHPSCLFAPRHLIDKTSLDFAARPPAYDHFGLFTKELARISNSADLDMVGLRQGTDFYHLAGLTQNYHAQPYFKPNEFLTYNRYALRLPIAYNNFRTKMEEIDTNPATPFFLSDTVMEVLPKIAKEKQNG
jgi:hypothetical protein